MGEAECLLQKHESEIIHLAEALSDQKNAS